MSTAHIEEMLDLFEAAFPSRHYIDERGDRKYWGYHAFYPSGSRNDAFLGFLKGYDAGIEAAKRTGATR